MNATELSESLSRNAEAVCRQYLPNGIRHGRYWICGNAKGKHGQSMHVRLTPPGIPGKWTDEATGEHGDLLDIIRISISASELRDAIVEGHRFLSLPLRPPTPMHQPASTSQTRNRRSAYLIWKRSAPLPDTHADAYLRNRGIQGSVWPTLRFHPSLNHLDANVAQRLPALVAAVLDNDGMLRGIHRTWLDRARPAKAPVSTPRKALGTIHGYAVRFGRTREGGFLIAGEGLETVLSIITAVPAIPAVAALSAAHLGGFAPPPDIGRIIIARDADPEGGDAALRLRRKCLDAGIDAVIAEPRLGDFNDDLIKYGPEVVAAAITPLLRMD